jgi:hypothetical protein
MTRLTALIIQTNGDDIRCESAKDADSKQFIGVVNLYKSGSFHYTLLSSRDTFETPDAAVKAIKKVVEDIRAIDLSN